MTLPLPTHNQTRVLRALHYSSAERISGATLRRHLADDGKATKGPAFYQLMMRLTAAGLVTATRTQRMDGKQIKREQNYAITPKGVAELARATNYYSAHCAA